jgi:uncharacterized protein (DUF1499 family)
MSRFLITTAVLCLLCVAALTAYLRYAPVEPGDWNIPVAAADPVAAGPCIQQIRLVPKGARATCLLPGTPEEVLAKLGAIALATERTRALAASDGLATWESRSRLMGFPDYITAEVAPAPGGTRLDIFSRQRFGGGDGGVNAARLKAWLSQLQSFMEAGNIPGSGAEPRSIHP